MEARQMKKADIRVVQPFGKGWGLAATGFQGGQVIAQGIIGPKKSLTPRQTYKEAFVLKRL
jgi:hypothetical protein